MSGHTTLYRIYGERRELIYVGVTSQPTIRLRQHSEKFWWSEVRNVETEEYPTRAEALAAEATAIKTESPKYNIQGLPSAPKRERSMPRVNDVGKKNLITIQEAAEYLGVCTRTVRRYIAEGDLAAYVVGSRKAGRRPIRVDQRDVEALLRPIGGWAW